MGYINRLQDENHELKAKIAAMESAILDFEIHLTSDKFVGFEADGSRRDWIATRDVFRYLELIRHAEPEENEIAA